MLSQYLMIGEITKPQGVRGEVKVRPCTCDPERFEGLETVYIEKDGGYAPLAVTVNRLGADAVFMNVAGVTDRDMAEKLRGTLLYIDRAHAVELDAGPGQAHRGDAARRQRRVRVQGAAGRGAGAGAEERGAGRGPPGGSDAPGRQAAQ